MGPEIGFKMFMEVLGSRIRYLNWYFNDPGPEKYIFGHFGDFGPGPNFIKKVPGLNQVPNKLLKRFGARTRSQIHLKDGPGPNQVPNILLELAMDKNQVPHILLEWALDKNQVPIIRY